MRSKDMVYFNVTAVRHRNVPAHVVAHARWGNARPPYSRHARGFRSYVYAKSTPACFNVVTVRVPPTTRKP